MQQSLVLMRRSGVAKIYSPTMSNSDRSAGAQYFYIKVYLKFEHQKIVSALTNAIKSDYIK